MLSSSALLLLLPLAALVQCHHSHYPQHRSNPYRFELRPSASRASSHRMPSGGVKLNRFYSKKLKIPVHTKHQISFKDYPEPEHNDYPVEQPKIEVSARSIPLSLVFRSSSSPLKIKQVHQAKYRNPDEEQSSYSVDGPHYLKNTITKPVYQIVREYIQPYRKHTQVIQPVREEVRTNIATPSSSKLYGQPVEPVLYMSPDYIETKPEVSKPTAPTVKLQLQEVTTYSENHFPVMEPAYSKSHFSVVDSTYSKSHYPMGEPTLMLTTAGHGEPQRLITPPQTPVMLFDVTSNGISHGTSSPTGTEQLPKSLEQPVQPTLIPLSNELLSHYLQLSQITANDLLLPVFETTTTHTHTLPGDGASAYGTVPVTISTAPVSITTADHHPNLVSTISTTGHAY